MRSLSACAVRTVCPWGFVGFIADETRLVVKPVQVIAYACMREQSGSVCNALCQPVHCTLSAGATDCTCQQLACPCCHVIRGAAVLLPLTAALQGDLIDTAIVHAWQHPQHPANVSGSFTGVHGSLLCQRLADRTSSHALENVKRTNAHLQHTCMHERSSQGRPVDSACKVVRCMQAAGSLCRTQPRVWTCPCWQRPAARSCCRCPPPAPQ